MSKNKEIYGTITEYNEKSEPNGPKLRKKCKKTEFDAKRCKAAKKCEKARFDAKKCWINDMNNKAYVGH